MCYHFGGESFTSREAMEAAQQAAAQAEKDVAIRAEAKAAAAEALQVPEPVPAH